MMSGTRKVITISAVVAVLIGMAWTSTTNAAPATDITCLTPLTTVTNAGGYWYWKNNAVSPDNGSGASTFNELSGYVLKDEIAGYYNHAYTFTGSGPGGLWYDLGSIYTVRRVEVACRRTSDVAHTQGSDLYGSAVKSKDPVDIIGQTVVPTMDTGSGYYWSSADVDWAGVQYVRIQGEGAPRPSDGKTTLNVADMRILAEVPVVNNGYIGHVHADVSSTLVNYSWDSEAITDNRGMSDAMNPGDKTATHAQGTSGWMTAASDPAPAVTFDLGGMYDLDQMLIWNHNQTTVNTCGFNEVLIEYSDNGGLWYYTLPDMNGGDLSNGNYTIPMAPVDGEGYTLGDSVYQLAVDFGGIENVDHVKITGYSNHGDASYYGLAEVRFYEPFASAQPGDTNNDGYVNAADAQTLAQYWLADVGEGGASMGDFNGDHVVNDLDASILAANWGATPSEGVGVPEPSTWVLLLTLTLGGLWLRRSR